MRGNRIIWGSALLGLVLAVGIAASVWRARNNRRIQFELLKRDRLILRADLSAIEREDVTDPLWNYSRSRVIEALQYLNRRETLPNPYFVSAFWVRSDDAAGAEWRLSLEWLEWGLHVDGVEFRDGAGQTHRLRTFDWTRQVSEPRSPIGKSVHYIGWTDDAGRRRNLPLFDETEPLEVALRHTLIRSFWRLGWIGRRVQCDHNGIQLTPDVLSGKWEVRLWGARGVETNWVPLYVDSKLRPAEGEGRPETQILGE